MTKSLLALAAVFGAGLAHAEAVTYNIDPTHTFVTFEASHFNTSTLRGRFDRKDGAVVLDRQAKTGKAEITIETGSVSTGVGPLDGHLKSKDFFNAGESPSVKFVGDKFSFDGDKVASVSGTLTMVGKTLPVTLKATSFNCYTNPLLKREVCGGDFADLVAVERELVGTECDGAVLGGVEEVFALQPRVERRHAGVDRVRVDGDLGLAGLRCLVDHHRAFLSVESAAQRRRAEVIRLEGDEGVARVDRVGRALGLRDGRRGGHQRGEEQPAHAQSGPTPVSVSLNLTCTSLATIEVSFQSPSPILKSSRLMTNAPLAVVFAPVCASTTGTVTS